MVVMTVADCVSMVIDSYVERDEHGCRPVAVLPSMATCHGDLEGMADWALAAAAVLAAGSDLRVESCGEVETGAVSLSAGDECDVDVVDVEPMFMSDVASDSASVIGEYGVASPVVTPEVDGYAYLAAYEPTSWGRVSGYCGAEPTVAAAFGPDVGGGVLLPSVDLESMRLVPTVGGSYGVRDGSTTEVIGVSLMTAVNLLKHGVPELLGSWACASLKGAFGLAVCEVDSEFGMSRDVVGPVAQPSGYCYLACFSDDARVGLKQKCGVAPTLSTVLSFTGSDGLLPNAALDRLWFVMDDNGHVGVWHGKPREGFSWSVREAFGCARESLDGPYVRMLDLPVGGVSALVDGAVAVSGSSCVVCEGFGGPCWPRVLDTLAGRPVSGGAETLTDALERLSFVGDLLSSQDKAVRVLSRGGVYHLAMGDSSGAYVGDTLCVVTLGEMLTASFRAWLRALPMCGVGSGLSLPVGRRWCANCGCVVRDEGHEDRCTAPRALEDVQVRNAAWFGDIAQAMDVRYCILAAGLPPVEATVRAVGYVSAEGQVEWAVQNGVDFRLPPDASLHRRSTHFEAQYMALRPRYVRWLVTDLGLEPQVGVRLLAGLSYSAFCDVVPGLEGCGGRTKSDSFSSGGGAVLCTPSSSDCDVFEVPWVYSEATAALVLCCSDLRCRGYEWKSRTRFLRHCASSHAGDQVLVVPPSGDTVRAVRALRVGADVKTSGEDWRVVYRCPVSSCAKSTVEWFDLPGFEQHLVKHG